MLSAACRLPGADDPETFWSNLLAGIDHTTVIPTSRWDPDAFYDPGGRPGTTPSKWGAFVRDPWEFPAERFRVRARDAAWIDPQQRLVLTCAQEALTAAGVDPREQPAIGVFVGTSYGSFAERVRDLALEGAPLPGATILGVLDNMLAARVSHALDLRGPAMTIDSACSSLFVALHTARRALEAGDCEVALVGATHMLMSPIPHLIMGRAGALSPSGRCRPFSADADGLVLGEGVGVFVMADAQLARARGWPIMAHVRGTAIDNDGRTLNPMAPRPGAQVDTITRAWDDAGLDPRTASLIEAHGTGTAIGDPVEAASLIEAFSPSGAPRWLGSVKGNVGHMMSAAGVPSLLKVLWALRRRKIPPTLLGSGARAELGLERAGFVLPRSTLDWTGAAVLRAGVNSFGFGGTNAHLVLEEARPPKREARAVVPIRGGSHPLAAPRGNGGRVAIHPLLRRRLSMRLLEASFAAEAPADHPLLAQHRVAGRAILPATALCDLMLVAASEAAERPASILEGVQLHRPARAGVDLRVGVALDRSRLDPLRLRVWVEDDAGELAAARVVWGEAPPGAGSPTLESPTREELAPAELYAGLAARGMEHGPLFRLITSLSFDAEGQRLAAELRPSAPPMGTRLDPFAVDAALQTLAAVLMRHPDTPAGLWIPASIDAVELHRPLTGPLRVLLTEVDASLDAGGRAELKATVHITGAGESESRVVLRGVCLRPIPAGRETGWFEVVEWTPVGEASSAAQRPVFCVPDSDDPLLTLRAVRDAVQTTALEPAQTLVVVTRRAFATDASDGPARPSMAAAATYAAALAAEGHRCLALDLDPEGSLELVAEAPGSEALLAVRSGEFRRRVLRSAEAPERSKLPDGVWLLLGGATGITAAIAQMLAAPGRTLLLVGRTPLGEAPERLARVRSLRKLGATVLYLQADTRTADARPLLAAIAGYGPLVGVVYGAGVVGPGRALERRDEDIADVLATKLGGAMALARALEREQLSPQVLLLSSLSGVEPARLGGQVADYAAANAGLDALAQAQRARGRPWTSISYSVWAEVGLGVGHLPPALLAARALRALEPEAAARAALRALSGEAAHHVVVDRVSTAKGARVESTPEDLEAFVRQRVARALGVDPSAIDSAASFADLGLDSIDAIDLVRALEEVGYGPLSDALVFEQRSIASLVSFLELRGPKGTREAARELADPRVGRVATALAMQTRLDPRHTPFVYLRQRLSSSCASLDAEGLRRALQRLVDETPALRCALRWDGGTLRRDPPAGSSTPSLATYRVRSPAALARLDDALANGPIALDRPPALRAALIRGPKPDEEHLAITAHHAVVDGWSLQLLARTLWALYMDPDARSPEPRADVPEIQPVALADQLAWAKRVELPWPSLPGLTGGPPVGPRRAVVRSVEAPAQIARGAGKEQRFALVVAAFAKALGQWAGLEEVVIQVASGRREQMAGHRGAIGSFADTIPLRLDVAQVCARLVREAWDDALTHGAPGLVDLAAHLPEAPDRGPRVASPFGLSLATFRANSELGPRPSEIVARTASGATRLGLTLWLLDERLGFAINYPPAWIVAAAVEELADCLEAALDPAALDPAALGPALDPERSRSTAAAGRPSDARVDAKEAAPERAPEDDPASFLEGISRQCGRSPSSLAAVSRAGTLTYAELEDRSARLASSLAARGIGPGGLVGVMAAGGRDALVALLGVLRSGAAWLPLEPALAPARLRMIVEQADPRLVLVCPGDAAAESLAALPRGRALTLDRVLEAKADAGPAPAFAPRDRAYVIFTSGSSGRPKGVPVHHGALSHYLRWSLEMMGLGPEDRLLQTSALTFDAVLRQLLAPLGCGAAVHLTTPAELRDPDALWARACDEAVTVINTSPAAAARLLDAALRQPGRTPPLRLLTLGGEALSASLVDGWRARVGEELRVVNLYGPTETTINATWHELAPGEPDPIPIGRPLPGYELAILDPDGREAREGELCVGGVGVFEGYLGEVATPWVEREGRALYRTGDRVRRRADGALLFLGRIDAQVQIRGVRVEPAEVEAALSRLPGVRLAVALPNTADSPTHLLAWVEAEAEGWDEEGARAALRAWLPDAFLPRRIYRVDELPLGPTGKVERRAQEVPVAVTGEEAPRGASERRVAAIWARVLDRDPATLGRSADFFALGGDSMAALEVVAALAAPGASTLYQHPRLCDLAAALEAAPRRSSPSDPGVGEGQVLLPAQVGFLRAERLAPERPARWRGVFRLEGEVDVDALQRAWTHLHLRHPALRTCFADDEVHVRSSTPPPLTVVTADGAPPFDPPMDPSRDWLVRGRLLRGPQGDALEVLGHHLIGDGWSVAVVLQELCAAHDAFAAGTSPELPELPTSPEQVAAHVAGDRPTPEVVEFWRSTFAAPVAPLFERAGPRRDGSMLHTARGAPEASAAEILGAVYDALREQRGQDDLTLGVARDGRDLPLPGVDRVVAPLATALPIRISATQDEDPRDAARAALRAALARPISPPELARALRPAPLPDVAVFVTDLRLPLAPPEGRLRVDLRASRTQMQLPEGIALQVAVQRGSDASSEPLRLRFTAADGPWAASRDALEDFADATLRALRRPVPAARPRAKTGRRAALITYLPPAETLREQLGVDPRAWLPSEGRVIGELDAGDLGSCTVWCLPQFADELQIDLGELAGLVERACATAEVVALAGLLPSMTAYGNSLLPRLAPQHARALTTGHATTAVAVARTTLRALDRVRARWSAAQVAVLGVGSIGRAALGLLLRREGPPAGLTLCDLPERRALVERFAARLGCPVTILDGGAAAPDALYRSADLILGATSRADVLEVARLRPGTLVVDDSFPPCFDARAARARMQTQRDVLLLGGGRIHVPGLRIRPARSLAAWVSERKPDALLPAMGLPGCAADALLAAPALGLVSDAAVDRAWASLDAAKAGPAPLHAVDAAPISPELLDALARLRAR